MMCLNCTAHPHLYLYYASLVLHNAYTERLLILKRFLLQIFRKDPRITSVQYCGGCSVLQTEASVLRGIASVLQRDSISTAVAVQYPAVLNSLRSTESTLHGVKESSFQFSDFSRLAYEMRDKISYTIDKNG